MKNRVKIWLSLTYAVAFLVFAAVTAIQSMASEESAPVAVGATPTEISSID